MPDQMTYSFESVADDTAVVHVGSSLDYRNASDFKAECQQAVSQGVSKFVLDFSQTGILDSSGLGAIFSLLREVNARSGKICMAALSHPVRVVAQITRIPRVVRSFDSVGDAVAFMAT